MSKVVSRSECPKCGSSDAFTTFLKYVKTDCDGGCWNWSGYVRPNGYGAVMSSKNGKRTPKYAHRVSYEFFIGKIPDGAVVCHSCDNRKCVNPHHLWVGTQSDNLIDMTRKGRNKSAKLSYELASIIRQKYNDGGTTHRKLAKEFGVGKSTITRALNGETWGL